MPNTELRAKARNGCLFPSAGKGVLFGAYSAGQKLDQLPDPLTLGQAVELNRIYKGKVVANIQALDVPEYLKTYPTAVFTPDRRKRQVAV